MIINRHNYEEFFLLYVDNELDAVSRNAIETFVSQNADLAAELRMLQQATLADDTIKFNQKELLYKEEKSISPANYEEYFLLFADNELNEQQAAEVESFILMHPELQNEFTLLQQTRLQPEVIAFAGKEMLYRKEKKVRRIVPFALVRMGAAAAVAGIAYLSFIIIDSNSSSKKIITASEKTIVKISDKNKPDAVQRSVTEQPDVVFHQKNENNKATNAAANNKRRRKDDNRKVKKAEKQEEQLAAQVKEHESKIQNFEQHKADEESADKEADVAEVQENTKILSDNKKLEIKNDSEKSSLITNPPIAKEDKPVITHAVYLETDNVEEEKSLYIGSAELNKNKFKGLLKKAAVFLDKKIRRNNDNDN